MGFRKRTVLIARLIAVAGTYWIAQAVQRRLGASEEELAAHLPGDEIVEWPRYDATRAISIAAEPEQVWPWLLQLGQGRGGFYSYDKLENLIGLGIHSATEIRSEWQDLAVGDPVKLADQVALEVRQLDAPHALVLAPMADQPTPVALPFAFSWSFVLREQPEGGCRLIVRERYDWSNPFTTPLFHVVGWVSALMTQKMLRTIRDRSQSA